MKKVFCLAIFALSSVFIFAKDFSKDFSQAFSKGDMDKVQKIVVAWEKAEPENPEMMIACFNYYLQRNLKTQLTMGEMDDGRYGLYEDYFFDDDDVKTGVSYLDKALEKNPDRLDIHFGKCTALLRSKNYEDASVAVIELLETSVKVDNTWKWTNGEPVDFSGEEALFSGVNDYCSMLINKNRISEKYLENLIEKILELYPENIIGLNHAARFYNMRGNNQKGIELLKRALEIDPEDYIVLGNLAYMNELENNFEEARKYYKIMLEFDDPDIQEYAQMYLDQLDGK